jgi:hypothetical protein
MPVSGVAMTGDVYVEMPWRQNGPAHPSVYYLGALNRRLKIEWTCDHHPRSGHVTVEAAAGYAQHERSLSVSFVLDTRTADPHPAANDWFAV